MPGELGSHRCPDTENKRILGNKQYELSNHLGNVNAVITDIRIGTDDLRWTGTGYITSLVKDGLADYYRPTVVSATDYYPFGWAMPGRKKQGDYRFGFNGQETDSEISGNTNTHYTAEYWMMDSRIGRRWELDPMVKLLPFISPYSIVGNNPITNKDKNGDIWTNVVSGIVSGALDWAAQGTVNLAKGQSFEDAFIKNVDWFDVGASVVVGAITPHASFAKYKRFTEGISEVGKSIVDIDASGVGLTLNPGEVILESAVNVGFGRASEKGGEILSAAFNHNNNNLISSHLLDAIHTLQANNGNPAEIDALFTRLNEVFVKEQSNAFAEGITNYGANVATNAFGDLAGFEPDVSFAIQTHTLHTFDPSTNSHYQVIYYEIMGKTDCGVEYYKEGQTRIQIPTSSNENIKNE